MQSLRNKGVWPSDLVTPMAEVSAMDMAAMEQSLTSSLDAGGKRLWPPDDSTAESDGEIRYPRGRNLLSAGAGARVVGCSSEMAGCAAQNLLTPFENEIWLSAEALPQHVTVRVAAGAPPLRAVGWACWHAFTTNPRAVRVEESADGEFFERVDELVVMEGPRRGVHLFELARPARGPFIRLQARALIRKPSTRTLLPSPAPSL